VGGGTFFVYSSKLKHMSKLIKFLLAWLFGKPIKGEPVDMDIKAKISTKVSYPENHPTEFFAWSKEFRVGCCTHNRPVFY
jgi:hypothetical protein